MDKYIGIDLGTGGVKALLVDELGDIPGEATRSYSCLHPREGYSEQDPECWYGQTMECLKELLQDVDKSEVKAISFGGQMHGLVMLDENDNVLRPAILWNDGRATAETRYLNETIGRDKISAYTGNIAFPGFLAPKLLWVYNNERDLFDRATKIMLPKDYLIYRMSGCFATDVSDASGMLLLDVRSRKYSREMLELCHITQRQLPALYESYETVGNITQSVADQLGLPREVKIVAGAGDNAAAAVGTGTVGDGACNISLGTSGTIFISGDRFGVDDKNALHSFCDASGKYHLMGCILSAAGARSWWLEDILDTRDYDMDEDRLADSSVIFLPYLTGERSPHNDVDIRGAFVGLSVNTTTGQMSQAVMEGVAFALKDCLNIARGNGYSPTYTTICGGGAKSDRWKQIVADVLEMPVKVVKTNQGASFGAAILAMVGDGKYPDVAEASKSIVEYVDTIYPDADRSQYYTAKYAKYVRLYPALKSLEDNKE